jgi:hypothetical protein
MRETCNWLSSGYFFVLPLLTGLDLHLLLLLLKLFELPEEHLLVFVQEVFFMFDLLHLLSGPFLFRGPLE